MKKFFIIFLVLSILVFTGCFNNQINNEADNNINTVTLNISAAASLTDCLEEIKAIYIKENPNVKDIVYNFGSSGALQQQIEQGAPADIFLSAGQKQMETLIDKNLMVNESVRDILENKVVLITPVDAPKVETFEELVEDNVARIGVGEPGSVPVGQYTEEIFANLNLTETVAPKLIFAKDVREVLSWVETGNVDAGVVYETDAKITDKVTICAAAPEGSHKPVIYPVGIVKSSKVPQEAQNFVDFLFSDKAREIFIKYGFTPLF